LNLRRPAGCTSSAGFAGAKPGALGVITSGRVSAAGLPSAQLFDRLEAR
jgi:hypothetical protein